jgi:hypothetical protein
MHHWIHPDFHNFLELINMTFDLFRNGIITIYKYNSLNDNKYSKGCLIALLKNVNLATLEKLVGSTVLFGLGTTSRQTYVVMCLFLCFVQQYSQRVVLDAIFSAPAHLAIWPLGQRVPWKKIIPRIAMLAFLLRAYSFNLLGRPY